jgi:hypothetical protein
MFEMQPYILLQKWKDMLLYAGILCFIFMIFGCSGVNKPAQNISRDSNLTEVERGLGIEIQAIRLSAGGYILDFRYKAIDPNKANILFSREIQPYLLHEATGRVITVPATTKIGPLRNTTNQPVAGKIYFMLFGNAGKLVKAGDKVTVIFGDYRMEHLTVE